MIILILGLVHGTALTIIVRMGIDVYYWLKFENKYKTVENALTIEQLYGVLYIFKEDQSKNIFYPWKVVPGKILYNKFLVLIGEK